MSNSPIFQNSNFFLKARYLDIRTGHPWVVVVHEEDGKVLGIRPGDELVLKWESKKTEVGVNITRNLVDKGEIGIFRDIFEKYQIKEGEILELALAPLPSSLESIKKKLLGKELNYEEALGIISDIVNYRLDDIQIAFFIAPAFEKSGFSNQEIYYLTKAMAETGEMMFWEREIVADKHSIGGVPGNRTTPLVVSIIASLGILIPKTSSRAITSEAGTADVIETVAPVEFDMEKIKEIVNKANGCIVWGGSLRLAPADDRILRVSYSFGIEPLSKMIISVMSKKVAIGATHLVIDLPIGKGLKIKKISEAKKTEEIFLFLAKKFNIKTRVVIDKISGPIGRGIGPALEIRDVLMVLEQKENRPLDLEKRAGRLAGALLEIIGKAEYGEGEKLAQNQLSNGEGLKKFKEIISLQGGRQDIDSDKIILGSAKKEILAEKGGVVEDIDSKAIIRIARLLGSPSTKEAGVYLNKIIGERVEKGEVLATLYTNSDQRISLAMNELSKINLFQIK